MVGERLRDEGRAQYLILRKEEKKNNLGAESE